MLGIMSPFRFSYHPLLNVKERVNQIPGVVEGSNYHQDQTTTSGNPYDSYESLVRFVLMTDVLSDTTTSLSTCASVCLFPLNVRNYESLSPLISAASKYQKQG